MKHLIPVAVLFAVIFLSRCNSSPQQGNEFFDPKTLDYLTDSNLLNDYSGKYFGGITLEVWDRNDSLFVTKEGTDTTYFLNPVSEDVFYLKELDTKFQFSRDRFREINNVKLRGSASGKLKKMGYSGRGI